MKIERSDCFCCYNMEYYVNKNREISYDIKFRSFHLRLEDDEHYCTRQQLYYCPWCGTKLPEDLDGVWSKTLREEYNIHDPIFDDANKVPPEFKTDEWWKKRGL
jgi:hypothetical protein